MANRSVEAKRLLTTALLLGGAVAQAPTADFTVQVAFARAALRGAVPAIAWLCEQELPSRPEWPENLDADRPFAVEWTAHGLRVLPLRLPLADGIAASGACRLGDGPSLLWQCTHDGIEDWFVPLDLVLPTAWRVLLHDLDADVLGTPRTITLSVVVGHLAGGLADGDPRAEFLQLGASQCGDVTWFAWRTTTHVRVRGRSEGGLMLPALLTLLAHSDGPAPSPLAVRAYAARDGERPEATRQLGVATAPANVETLRDLLHADDTTRLCAIDALIRRGAADELPFIVAAGEEQMPLAAMAAADALRALWIDASPLTRQQTRTALQHSDCLALRSLDLDALPRHPIPAPPAEPTLDHRLRALVWLALLGIGMLGVWLRERRRCGEATA